MNTNKKVPEPILFTILKIILCCTGMMLLGVVCAIVSADWTLFLLSAIVMGIGIVRANNIKKQVEQKDYVILEGRLVNAEELNLQNKYKACFTLADGSDKTIRISGKARLKVGTCYRLYLTKPVDGCDQWSLPEYLKPAQQLLGFELIT